MPERISTGRAADICGFDPKTVRKLAEDGIIPGAAFLGHVWRFNERQLRDWIRRREEKCGRGRAEPTSTGAAASGGRGSKSMAATSDEAYERALNWKPESG